MVAGAGRDLDVDRRARGRQLRDAERIRVGLPAGPDVPPQTSVRVLDRCLAIIDAVDHGARSFTDIAGATDLPQPTAHRLLQALEDHGLVMHVGGLGYVLGTRLLGLASRAMGELPLRELAHPTLERLARSTGESAQLFVRDGDRRVCVDVAESASELRTIVEIGASLPLTKGSAGKVFLAWAGEHDRDRLLETADEPDRLAQQLLTTRRRGWADSVAEREPGVASVSAPVFGPDGTLLAAVSVSGPAARLGKLRAKRSAPAVMEAAREIEGALGT